MEGGKLLVYARKRGRKRKNVEVDDVMMDRDGKKRDLASRPMVYVGRYVKKEFDGRGVLLGKVGCYDEGVYRVEFEDGSSEDLGSDETEKFLIELEGEWGERRKRLDELVENKYGKEKGEGVNGNVELGSIGDDNCDVDEGSQSDCDFGGDADLCRDFSAEDQELESRVDVVEVPLVSPPELPCSSGNIGIPDEYVSHFFSVYSFLRSFSIQLFLSPFGLDDFVGSLNCTVPNTLLESVHVALLRILRSHLEKRSSDGSELASNCLRLLDWNLLDTLTWPIYLVHYLKLMGHTNGPELKDFCDYAMEKDYFTLSAGWKLLALQILCNDVLDSVVIRYAIDVREESEVGIESDAAMAMTPSCRPRRGHPRSKNSASKDQEAMPKVGGHDARSDDQDDNIDECRLCGMGGIILCCDGCPLSYHSRCIGVSKVSIPEGEWFCPECTMNKIGPAFRRETSLKGAEVFGIDPYEQVFVGTCNYLLVLDGSINSETCLRYYSGGDIPRLLEALHLNIHHISLYKEICKRIISYWEIPEGVDTADVLLFVGSSFKIQGYINNYLHGDFAASAAAGLSALTPLDVQAPISDSIESRRKIVSANYALQEKAFSSAAMRFFWPHTEKKLVEGPRERCSWCLSCNEMITSKRGCLLNAAVAMANKGAIKKLATLCPPKNVEGSIYSVASYIMFMEESLSGLTEGPFQSSLSRKQWCKQLEQATSCSLIKTLLLVFEENIRTVAFSGDWMKRVDGWSAESSLVVQSGALAAVGSTQKHRPGRFGRKASVVTEVAKNDSRDKLTDITWWSGDQLSNFFSEKGAIPRASVKKAARKGSSRRVPGVYYTEGVETSKRNRKFVWRAAVDMCKNAAQLALQVRYLDLHVKWADLVRPEQSAQEAKGPETESSLFRNAFIRDKKIVDDETRYSVAFRNQKHLPSKVIKNILEKEQTKDGKEKYWFSEFRIPLYLIKDFEVKAAKKALLTGGKSNCILSILPRKQLEISREDIFSYLAHKRDNDEKIHCASCRLGVLIGNAVQCSACQGFCHESCTLSSTVQMSEEVQYITTCKDCYEARVQIEKQRDESPTSPLLSQGQVFPNAEMSLNLERNGYVKPTKEAEPASLSKSKCNWGLIWRKKKGADLIGDDFIIRNILLKGNPHIHSLKPECRLCSQPYSPDLMYIHCETCKNWFHADAVELQEENIFDLLGFKCCKCRKIKTPRCPYSGTDDKKIFELKKLRVKGPELGSPIPGSMQDSVIGTKGISHFARDDPLLVCSSEVEQQSENHPPTYHEQNTSNVSSPKRLRVKRCTNREKDEDLFTADGSGHNVSSTFEGRIGESIDEPANPEWEVSANGFDDDMIFDFDCLDKVDAESEPHTLFSSNEILAADNPKNEASKAIQMNEDLDSLDKQQAMLAPKDFTTEASNAIKRNEHLDSLDNQQRVPAPKDFTTDTVLCFICSHGDPPCDCVCEICDMTIHCRCSPWIETPSGDGEWKCGNCREWQ